MIIVDEPFVSPEFAAYLETSKHPVLDNAMARRIAQAYKLNLVPDDQFARKVEDGARLYTSSENALSWVSEHVHVPELTRSIGLCKDKARMRKLLAPLCPDVFCRRVGFSDLRSVDLAELPMPFVLKPTVGFCSVGVYVIESAADWTRALDDLDRNAAEYAARYPESVVDEDEFVIESYLAGDEYAVDAYFDESGAAHVLNVMRHEFASDNDTTDRLYCTGAPVIRKWVPRFEAWLDEANAYLGSRAFPVHVEVRVLDGRITPIEFNPLRFAGLCCTDIAQHAYGFRTYDYYLNNIAPNWDRLLAGKEDKLFCMSCLPAPDGITPTARFDMDAFCEPFDRVLARHELDPARFGLVGIVFCETDIADPTDRNRLLREDLARYMVA